MIRKNLMVGAVGAFGLAIVVAPLAFGQAPAATGKPAAAPTASPKVDNKVNPNTGLPNWHPPVGAEPSPQAQPPMRPGHDQQNVRQMIDQLKRGSGAVPSEPAKIEARKYPRDEHGYCIGQGPDDPPKNVNLFHGWLGVNNEKAVLPPPRIVEAETGWFAQRFGSTAWWKWRLTPYAWRYENHDDECDPRNTPIPLLANLINFGVLMLIVTKFGAKPVAEALKKRRDTIMSEIDRAQAMKESASKRLTEYQSDLDNLDTKLSALRTQYAEEGELEEKRLREELTQARDRMMADASFRVEQEGKTTRDNLSRDALEGALGGAETLLGAAINDDDHNRLCEEFLDQLGGAFTPGAKDGGATGAAT
jgi:F-type H+-transporting ATPase subunit b